MSLHISGSRAQRGATADQERVLLPGDVTEALGDEEDTQGCELSQVPEQDRRMLHTGARRLRFPALAALLALALLASVRLWCHRALPGAARTEVAGATGLDEEPAEAGEPLPLPHCPEGEVVGMLGCMECPMGTYYRPEAGSGGTSCIECRKYSRRRRAGSCTDCARRPGDEPSAAGCAQPALLATEGLEFSFSIQVKVPGVADPDSVGILHSQTEPAVLSLELTHEQLIKLSLETVNAGKLQVSSSKALTPDTLYQVTVEKKPSYACLTIAGDKPGAVPERTCTDAASAGEAAAYQLKRDPGELAFVSSEKARRLHGRLFRWTPPSLREREGQSWSWGSNVSTTDQRSLVARNFTQASGQASASVLITGVNLALLLLDEKELGCLVSAVKAAVVSSARHGVQESDVSVLFLESEGGVLAQIGVTQGAFLAGKVQENLKAVTDKLGHRISTSIGIHVCKPPLKALAYPAAEAASVPAALVKCSAVRCPPDTQVSSVYDSGSCYGAACLSICCDVPPLDEENTSANGSGLPPSPPPVTAPSEPPWKQTLDQASAVLAAVEKKMKARITADQCNLVKGKYFEQGMCKRCEGGETRRRRAEQCTGCKDRTFMPHEGFDDCLPCPTYSRRRRASTCTACAETPKDKPQAGCSYLGLATDGTSFAFSVNLKFQTENTTVHLLQSPAFTLTLTGQEHGNMSGKILFSMTPLNIGGEHQESNFSVYSFAKVSQGVPYSVTTTKNATHLCLTVTALEKPHFVSRYYITEPGLGVERCAPTLHSHKELFQMKQPGLLAWGSHPLVELGSYKQMQGTVPMSFKVKLSASGDIDTHAVETSIQDAVAIYAGFGTGLSDVQVNSTLAEDGSVIDVQVTLHVKEDAPALLEDYQQSPQKLEEAVSKRLQQDLSANRQVAVEALVGGLALRSCAGWRCPAGSQLDRSRYCIGATCGEVCCAPMSCRKWRGSCSPLVHRGPLSSVSCQGEEDCAQKCCVGNCHTVDCMKKGAGREGAICPKPNSWALWYSPGQALETCCSEVEPPCCTDNNLAFCRACNSCQSKEMLCYHLSKEHSPSYLREIGCLEHKAPACDYHVKTSFFLHRGLSHEEPKAVLAIDALPDAEHAVSGGEDGVGFVWNVHTGEMVMALMGLTQPIRTVTAHFEPDLVSIAGDEGKVRTYTWLHGDLEKERSLEGAGAVLDIAHLTEAGMMGFTTEDGHVCLYSLENGDMKVLPHGGLSGEKYDSLVEDYLKEEHQYHFARASPLVKMAGDEAFEEKLKHLLPVNRSAVQPDPTPAWGKATKIVYFQKGLYFATGHDDGVIRLWSAVDGALAREMAGHAGPITALWAFDLSLEFLSGGMDGTIQRWDASTGKQLLKIFAGSGGAVRGLTMLPTTDALFSAHDDGSVRKWELKDGQEMCRISTNAGRVNDLAHNPGSTSELLTATQDGIARAWEPR